jgi:hypothetical protein
MLLDFMQRSLGIPYCSPRAASNMLLNNSRSTGWHPGQPEHWAVPTILYMRVPTLLARDIRCLFLPLGGRQLHLSTMRLSVASS